MTKVITVVESPGVPEGSVFDAGKQTIEGVDYWTGWWSSREGSYQISVPCTCCEVYNERVHDPLFQIRAQFANVRAMKMEQYERAELARLKAKYE